MLTTAHPTTDTDTAPDEAEVIAGTSISNRCGHLVGLGS